MRESSARANLRRGDGRPLVTGHRGASAEAAANSIEALEAAIAAGADFVELDVSPGLVVAHSAAEATADSVGLERALEAIRDHPVGVHLDVKLPGYEAEVLALVRQHRLEERTLFSTAWATTSRTFQRLAPELPRAIGYPRDRFGVSSIRWPDALTAAGAAALRAAMPVRVPLLLRQARADVLALHHALCSPAAIAAAHRAGAPVFAWTVNDPGMVRALAAAGVDGIVSDDPRMVLATLLAP